MPASVATSTEYVELAAQVENLVAHINAQDGHQDALIEHTKRMNGIDKRLDLHHSQINGTGSLFEDIFRRLGALEKKVEAIDQLHAMEMGIDRDPEPAPDRIDEVFARLSKINERIMDLEEDKFKRETMAEKLNSYIKTVESVARNEQTAKQVDIANETLRDFAAWVNHQIHHGVMATNPRMMIKQYDEDTDWHDRNHDIYNFNDQYGGW